MTIIIFYDINYVELFKVMNIISYFIQLKGNSVNK